MQTKTLLFKGMFIGCSRMHDQGIFLSEMYCSDSLEYSVRSITIMAAVATDVILIKGYRLSVRAL